MFANWHDRSKRTCAWNDPGLHKGFTTPQWAWEVLELGRIYREYNPKLAVEIGVYYGGSLQIWLENSYQGCTVIGIDPDPKPRSYEIPEGVTLKLVNGYSTDPAYIKRMKEIGPIDFLFIDGDHSYEGARADFENYGPLVRTGGVIAFHDIRPHPNDPANEVWRLWKDIQEAGYVTQELLAVHTQPQGGIGVVYV